MIRKLRQFLKIFDSFKKQMLVVFFIFIQLQLIRAEDLLWQFEPPLEHIYQSIIQLRMHEAKAALDQLQNSNKFQFMYLQSLLETVDILISEDELKFEKVEENIKGRLDYLSHSLRPQSLSS